MPLSVPMPDTMIWLARTVSVFGGGQLNLDGREVETSVKPHIPGRKRTETNLALPIF